MAVVGLHLLAVLLLLESTKTQTRVKPAAYVPLTLLSFAAQRPPAEASPTREPHPLERKPTAQPPIATPAPSNAITLPPPDWDAEAGAAARRQSEKDTDAERRRNLAGPSDSQLDWWKNNAPVPGEHHQPGDTEHAEGEVITWQDAKCFWTTRGLTTYGMPQTSKVCKDPFKPDTDMFKDMRKKLDERDTNRAP